MVCAAPWDRGTLNKRSIWSYYISTNFLGVLLCCWKIRSVWLNAGRTASDILIAGLCSACTWMSLTCGIQCLLSVIHDCFYGGDLACKLEAYFHVSAILTQFFSAAAIAFHAWWLVVKGGGNRGSAFTTKHAIRAVVVIWLVCILGTVIFSLFSSLYLMEAGTYCFFGFSSPAIDYWLIPGLAIALGIQAFCYIQIYRTVKSSENLVYQHSSDASASARKEMARRAFMFFIVLLLGWIFAAVAAIWELGYGITPEWLVTAVGVAGTTHSDLVPLIYHRWGRSTDTDPTTTTTTATVAAATSNRPTASAALAPSKKKRTPNSARGDMPHPGLGAPTIDLLSPMSRSAPPTTQDFTHTPNPPITPNPPTPNPKITTPETLELPNLQLDAVPDRAASLV